MTSKTKDNWPEDRYRIVSDEDGSNLKSQMTVIWSRRMNGADVVFGIINEVNVFLVQTPFEIALHYPFAPQSDVL
jgi:hypothetical protein